jgi:steroid delta-isomerase-like uncharacterized protein
VDRFYTEVWVKGNFDAAREMFTDDYVRHDLRRTEAEPGGAGQAKIAADFRAAFPDLVFEITHLIAEGDHVVGRWTANGTHTGSWGTVEPSGRRVTFSAVNIFRLREGKIVEIWNYRDDLALREQVGAPIYAGAVKSR